MAASIEQSMDGNINAVVTRKISSDEFVMLMVERRAEMGELVTALCMAHEPEPKAGESLKASPDAKPDAFDEAVRFAQTIGASMGDREI